MEPPSTAAEINIGGETSVKLCFLKYCRAASKTSPRTFITRFIFLLLSQRWRMSRMNSSLLSFEMGKVSASPMMLMVSAEISYPPGARLSSLAVPSKERADSIVSFWASLQQGLVFFMVDWMTPVESLISMKISSFPSRLRYTQPRMHSFLSLHCPSSMLLIFTGAIVVQLFSVLLVFKPKCLSI